MFVQILSDNIDMEVCCMKTGRWPGRYQNLAAMYSVCALLFFLILPQRPAFGLVSAPPLLGLVPSSARQSVLSTAESYVGTPYRYGGTTKSGMDCSGLVYISYLKATGIKIPRTVDALATWVFVIPLHELEPGDLVFLISTRRPILRRRRRKPPSPKWL